MAKKPHVLPVHLSRLIVTGNYTLTYVPTQHAHAPAFPDADTTDTWAPKMHDPHLCCWYLALYTHTHAGLAIPSP